MSNAKVLINTHAGTIELEGEDSFVRTYLDKLIRSWSAHLSEPDPRRRAAMPE